MPQLGNDHQEQTILRPNAHRSLIKPVSQVTLHLMPVQGKDRRTATIDEILRWIDRRAGRVLPKAAWDRGSFELSEIGAQRTAAVALTEPTQYWCAHLDDADKNVPLRTWTTEASVGIDDLGHVLFGARLVCSSRGVHEDFERSIPGFVKRIILSGPAQLDDVAVHQRLQVISTEADVDRLVDLLESPARLADVVLFSLSEGSENLADLAASAHDVHAATLGAAHVYVITGPASLFLTERVGRELSVFRQAVRTYRPGFRAWLDEPPRHPRAHAQRILQWQQEEPGAFERLLIQQILSGSVAGMAREDRLPSFNTVRQIAAQAERASLKHSGGSDAEMLELYKQDNDKLQQELKEQKAYYEGLLEPVFEERDEAVEDANTFKAQALERLHRIRVLEDRLGMASAHAATAIPTDLDGFEDWCKEHLTGSVELVNRAYQGVRKSEYEDPTLLYRALLLLRDHYVPMRLDGTAERRDAYLKALLSLGLEDSPTGTGPSFSPELYKVHYGGRRRALDKHLKGGDSRDRRYCFRLYYFWDDEEQVVVVGWLPSHLDNRAT